MNAVDPSAERRILASVAAANNRGPVRHSVAVERVGAAWAAVRQCQHGHCKCYKPAATVRPGGSGSPVPLDDRRDRFSAVVSQCFWRSKRRLVAVRSRARHLSRPIGTPRASSNGRPQASRPAHPSTALTAAGRDAWVTPPKKRVNISKTVAAVWRPCPIRETARFTLPGSVADWRTAIPAICRTISTDDAVPQAADRLPDTEDPVGTPRRANRVLFFWMLDIEHRVTPRSSCGAANRPAWVRAA